MSTPQITVKIMGYKLPHSLTQSKPHRQFYQVFIYRRKDKHPDLSMPGFTTIESAVLAAKESAQQSQSAITSISIDGNKQKDF
jgi:hypothetical protein